MSPRPVFVIAVPLDEPCADLLAGHGDADVHRLDVVAPGKLLVGLERLRATHAVLSTAQFDALRLHPAFALADLDTLGKIYLVGDAPLPVVAGFDVQRLATTRRDPALAVDGEIVAADTDKRLAGADYTAGRIATEALSVAALHSMLDGLRRAGAFIDADDVLNATDLLERVRADPHQRTLLRRWLRVLTAEGLLRHHEGRFRLASGHATEATPDWDHVQRLWLAAGDTAHTLRFARDAASALPELIDGSLKAVHLLFPQGDLALAHALYRESIAARYQHAAVASCLSRIAQSRQGARLRILEAGGGTGATTDQAWPALRDHDVDYLFTDVSRFFLQQVEARHPGLRTGLYDIDRSPAGQGHAVGSIDVIVAGGVLNAARNTDASLRWLASLLAPGGWLVLSEPTIEEYWVMASQAFMLAEPDDERAASQSTFLSHAQWLDALAGAGLQTLVDLPPPGHALASLGHRVFATQVAPTP